MTKTVYRDLTRLLGAMGLPLVLMFSFVAEDRFEALPADNMESTIGGKFERDLVTAKKCYRCKSENYCKQGQSCTKVGNFWAYLIGTGITQKFCLDMVASGEGGDGKTGCEGKDFKDCVKVKTCTDAACTNCGPLSAEQKTTRCEFSGDDCTAVVPTDGKDDVSTF